MASQKHALVLGASGISGWALVKELREFPSVGTWNRITATTNRPMSLEQARIPEDDRVKMVNGVDFLRPVEDVKKTLTEKISDISTVSHVFFTAYIEKSSFAELKAVNNQLLETAVTAVSSLATHLEAVVLQTGGKAYGVEFSKDIDIVPPLAESLPRIPRPFYDNVFYYTQCDILKRLSEGKEWTWTEVRPDVIIGFVPGSNAMDCARGVALFLSLYREVHGQGAKVPFPGTLASWRNKHTDTFQDILAQMEIHAALNPHECGGGEAYNIADGRTVTWEEKWPRLCEYFGLVGEGPPSDGGGGGIVENFVKEHGQRWSSIVEEHGLKINAMETYSWPFLYFVMAVFDFDRQYDLTKSRQVGFANEIDTVKGFSTAFDRLKAAKIIP